MRLLFALLLLVPLSAAAEDTGAAMAALKDGAAECRYLTELAQRVRRVDRRITAGQETEMDDCAGYQEDRHDHEALDRCRKDTEAVANLKTQRKGLMDDCLRAATVLGAKHEKLPTCSGVCDALPTAPK
jgi:hypothetical protein